MKMIFLGIIVLVSVVGCASKNHSGSYEQANRASDKAHMELMRDVRE